MAVGTDIAPTPLEDEDTRALMEPEPDIPVLPERTPQAALEPEVKEAIRRRTRP